MNDSDNPLVTPAWLAERLGDAKAAPDIVVLDATLFMPGDPRSAAALYAERRIPGAVFFDIEAISDQSTSLPHMLPKPEVFAAQIGALGIGDATRVVVSDGHGLFSAPRAWWSLRAMGHDDVVVLDGGLPAWERAGFALDTATPQEPPPRHFTPRYRADLVRDADAITHIVEHGGAQILDARSAARFAGEAPEPRAGLRSGHMPGARSMPFSNLLTQDGLFKSDSELRAIFAAAGVELDGPIVCSCGSGVTAAIVALALAKLGHWGASVYDGSWSEWGARDGAKIAVGA